LNTKEWIVLGLIDREYFVYLLNWQRDTYF